MTITFQTWNCPITTALNLLPLTRTKFSISPLCLELSIVKIILKLMELWSQPQNALPLKHQLPGSFPNARSSMFPSQVGLSTCYFTIPSWVHLINSAFPKPLALSKSRSILEKLKSSNMRTLLLWQLSVICLHICFSIPFWLLRSLEYNTFAVIEPFLFLSVTHTQLTLHYVLSEC